MRKGILERSIAIAIKCRIIQLHTGTFFFVTSGPMKSCRVLPLLLDLPLSKILYPSSNLLFSRADVFSQTLVLSSLLHSVFWGLSSLLMMVVVAGWNTATSSYLLRVIM
mmetsp:Transcript_3687/g.10758  ORF Transcript_3687/g.10758 Transcript_3687/m.10758 type:complete len:109 (+) Transcript_3687:342-668(+)